MDIAIDSLYKPGERTAVFESPTEALEEAIKKLEGLQRVVMHQLRQLNDVAPERAQADAVKRHVAETSELVRGLRIVLKAF